MIIKNTLTKLDNLYLLMRVWLEKDQFTGRIEINVNQGRIRTVLKVETINIAD